MCHRWTSCKYLDGHLFLSSVFLALPFFLFFNLLSSHRRGNSLERMKVTRSRRAARKDKNEAVKPTQDRTVGKRKAAIQADKIIKKQVKKDPNKPKRPPTAFFVFLEEFRKIYKQEHPKVKAVSAVGKAGGEKWKSMSDAEKAPYEAKAAKMKGEYQKLMTAYNKRQEGTDDDEEEEEEPEKSKSKTHDEDYEDSEEEDEEEDEEKD
ncbi:hypothetical protein SLA2020_061960 [Shorea laevis]